MAKRKDPADRIKAQVDQVLDRNNSVASICSGTCNEFGEHTLFKLIAIRYMLDVYCNVMKNNLPRGYRTCAFLDLMAGSGVTKLKGRNVYALGSSILAARESIKKGRVFGKVFSVEMESDSATALDQRMSESSPDQPHEVFPRKTEEVLPEILEEVTKIKAHPLVLIDYEGLDGIGFDDIIPLLGMRADLMITFIPSAFSRTEALPPVWVKLDKFWGSSSWRDHIDNQESLVNAYMMRLSVNDRRVERVDVQSETSGFWYAELFSVWRTAGGSPWMKAISGLQSLYETKPEFLSDYLDVVEGKKSTLERFC